VWWFQRSRRQPPPPEANADEPVDADALERTYRFLLDEELQNQRLSPDLREEIAQNGPLDGVRDGVGDFGLDIRNPIPVNGPFGEAQYLSSLMTEDGRPIAFQRLTVIDRVSVYETVTLDGLDWNFLFLSRYYARKSHLAPRGFRFARGSEQNVLIRGTDQQAEDFPVAVHTMVERFTRRLLGVSIADPRLRLLEKVTIRLPPEHQRRVQELRFGGASLRPIENPPAADR
jgi:hypothetical protein